MNVLVTTESLIRERLTFEAGLERAQAYALPPLVLGKERIREKRNGLFEYFKRGKLATLVQVEDRDGLPVDIVGWTEHKRWLLRKGCAVILGAPFLDYCETYQQQLPLFETPQSWLDSKGKGVCVLNWSAPIPELLWDVPVLTFESKALHRCYWHAVKEYAPKSELMA